jgi:hypothetical protein
MSQVTRPMPLLRPAKPPMEPDTNAHERLIAWTHINGYEILSRRPPCQKGTREWSELTKSADEWHKASKVERFGPVHQRICRHAARELEILRDYGFEVQIEPRTGKRV